MKKNCKLCGKEFETNYSNKVYCSSNCQLNSRFLRIGNKETVKVASCPICGKEFEMIISRATNRRKYCSKECSRIANIKHACKRKADKRMADKRKVKNISEKTNNVSVSIVFPDWVKPTRRGQING